MSEQKTVEKSLLALAHYKGFSKKNDNPREAYEWLVKKGQQLATLPDGTVISRKSNTAYSHVIAAYSKSWKTGEMTWGYARWTRNPQQALKSFASWPFEKMQAVETWKGYPYE